MSAYTFRSIYRFELRHWLLQPAFYLYAGVFTLFPMLAMAGAAGIFGEGSSEGIANSPYGIISMGRFFGQLSLFVPAALVGGSAYRDHRYRVSALLYTCPITEGAYLAAKWLAPMTAVLLIAVMGAAGLALGAALPGVNPEQVAAFSAAPYIQLLGLYWLPNLALVGAVVFAASFISRQQYAGLISLLAVLLLREIALRLSGGQHGGLAAALLDPLGETAALQWTQYWTAAERETNAMTPQPALWYNRLLWLTIAAGIGAAAKRRFSFRSEGGDGRARAPVQARNADPERATPHAPLAFHFGRAQQWRMVWRLLQADFQYVRRSGAFGILLLVSGIFAGVLLSQMNPVTDTRVLPMTWVALGFPVFFLSFFIQLVTFLYAGLLMRRPQAAGMQDLLHVVPAPDWVFPFAHWLMLLCLQLALLSTVMVVGVAVQLYRGHYPIEIGHYATDLLGFHFMGLAAWGLVALFVQALVGHPYVGIFLLLLGALGLDYLPSLGIHSAVFRFNQSPEPTFYLQYSDMAGYAHGWRAHLAYKAYWLLFALLPGIGALLVWRREIAHSMAERRALAWRRATTGYWGVAGVALTLVFAGAAIGLRQMEQRPDNRLPSAQEQQVILAQFRQQFGHLAPMPQPRITRLSIEVDIFPERSAFRAKGHYTLINKTNAPIDTLLVKAGYDEHTKMTFSVPAAVVAALPELRFSLYRLEQPLMPGDSIQLRFDIRNKPNTWLVRHSPVLPNGSYLKSDIFPRLGYFAETAKLPPTDSAARANHYQGPDADVIDFDAIVSTSAPQTAIAPGRLLRQWESRGRRYFHYRADAPIKFVLGFNSGVYEVLRAQHQGVDLAIWHHPGHSYCLSSIMRGLKAALDYNIAHFGPYPFKELSVVEFARTEGSYATTAANVIPMSEIRFVQDIPPGGKSPDLAFYVAAHELSHQWWGNQLMPADALGALMLTESLAEYTTAKVYEKTFGKAAVDKFLNIQWQRYLSGKAEESGPETDLAYVAPNQAYLAYGKGAVAFYALSDRMGERKFNAVLRAFLEQYKNQGPPYPTSLDLLCRLPPLD